jgi:hypothetical protein
MLIGSGRKELAHTVRGFISILVSKGGMKITSTRREDDGARVYEA